MAEVKKPRVVNRIVGLTKLGKELKKIRVDFEISRAQMAKELDISDKELGLIEIGKSSVTEAFLFRVADKYFDDDGDISAFHERLQLASVHSTASIVFNLTDLPEHLKLKVFNLKTVVDDTLNLQAKEKEEAAALEKERLAKGRQAKRVGKKVKGTESSENSFGGNSCGEVYLGDVQKCALPIQEDKPEVNDVELDKIEAILNDVELDEMEAILAAA